MLQHDCATAPNELKYAAETCKTRSMHTKPNIYLFICTNVLYIEYIRLYIACIYSEGFYYDFPCVTLGFYPFI